MRRTFLRGEMIKFNRLLERIGTSLDDCSRAIEGLVVMSQDLDGMYGAHVSYICLYTC